eukprot:CAMPEP_0170195972 /NCGR_PEP_ID=MMETSP0040_2-20121228/62751_1 /TAXON_ID=641309 /ORGANISM="Lotharella oceanica, Strain CCMP622" /LENGTH=65 /DNA_ID=CAMNT_0010445275 /DNA_START=38 /DNA_END=231 /DNA_ORIENTATION=+
MASVAGGQRQGITCGLSSSTLSMNIWYTRRFVILALDRRLYILQSLSRWNLISSPHPCAPGLHNS